MEYGLNKDQISRATTTAGDVEYASDLTTDNKKAKDKKAKKK